jgi:hypothetical protein
LQPGQSWISLQAMTDEKRDTGITFRVDVDELAEIDRLAAELTKRAAGVNVPRAAVAKQAMLRGIAVIRKELQK